MNIFNKIFTHPFKLLIDAFRNCWAELWKSIIILVIATIFFATAFYLFEGHLQKEYSNWFKDVLWAFCIYISDPGELGGSGPITIPGKIIATIIGIIRVFILVVPSGIIAGGFTEAFKEDKKNQENAKNLKKILKAFYMYQCRNTMFRCIPTYKSLTTLQVTTGLTTDDIIEAIQSSTKEGLRLRNIADSCPKDTEPLPPDKLIVEVFPTQSKNITNDKAELLLPKDYGCYINRGSNVTIVSTSSCNIDEIGNSHFAYFLAEFGGFNFISKEYDIDNDCSCYNFPEGTTVKDKTLTNENNNSGLNDVCQHFYDDLKELADSKDKWVIFILQVPRNIGSHLNFITNFKDESNKTICPEKESVFDKAYNDVEKMLANAGNQNNGGYCINKGEEDYANKHRLETNLNVNFKPIKSNNIGALLGNGTTTNAFTIRIASKLLVSDNRDVSIALKMAEIFRIHFVGIDNYIGDHKNGWQKDGVSFI